MGTTDLWMRDIITYYGTIVVGFTIISWILTRQWYRFQQNLNRSHLLGFEAECADLAVNYKKELFEPLGRMLSKDEILRSIGSIRVLEIGVKTGENIQFYPDGTHMIGVDCNKKLGDYLISGYRSGQFDHVYFERLIIGNGSSLKCIPSDCVDAVITTRSLCSTSSMPHTLQEIRRVLASGGKYFFLEHVPDIEGTFVHWLQKFLTKSRIWPSLFADCRLDSNPIENIKSAGFKELVYKSFILQGYVSQPYRLFLTRRHIVGTATK